MRQLRALLLATGVLAALPGSAAFAEEPVPVAPKPTENHPPKLVVVWPTFTPAGDDASPTPLHRPTSVEEPLATRAHELDATLRDATQDLGYVLDLDDKGPPANRVRDLDMIARAGQSAPGERTEASAGGTWVVSARLESVGTDTFLLRIVAVPPSGKELRARVEIVRGADVSLRGLVLLRDLLSPSVASGEATSHETHDDPAVSAGATTSSRSPGRAVLAANGALFGGYAGYSLVRSTGTNDPRVLYPLLTLGAAVGLGGALLVADEWDISTGDAWYLSAGAWWGAASGILLANGSTAQPEGPYAWGIGGGIAGLALGTFAITRSRMDEGDAILTHSGAGLGTWVGALVQLGYRGTTNVTPYTGAGLGAAIGLAGAGATSIFVTIPPSRVLLLDLGAGLGALAGAAACSPLIFSDLTGATTSATNTRLFLAGTLAGTAVGGTAAWFLTRTPSTSASKTAAWLARLPSPSVGIIGQSQTATGNVPAYGVMTTGTF